MTMLSRMMLATVSGAVLVTALPADARGYRRQKEGVDVGDIIAGALIIGGIAAIASASSRDRDRSGDPDYGRGVSRGFADRTAVEQCVRAAQRQASRYGGWARVTDVTRVERSRDGYKVRGRLVVERNAPDYSRDYGRDYGQAFGRGWDPNDRWGYDYDRYGSDYDKGRFKCVTRYGRVRDVDIGGLRG